MRIRKMLVPLAAMALVLAACGNQQASTPAGSDGAGADSGRGDITIEVVVHGQASDPFWSVVANGVEAAAADLGITANYRAPQSDDLDVVAMAQLIDTAIAAEPDGIIVSIPDADALREPIEAAIAAGIPVLSINSGSDVFKDLGLITHVGQTEFEAGVGAGERMAAEGVTNTICVNQEVGNGALDLRCEGFAEGLGGVPSEAVAVDLSDPASSQATIEAALSADPTIDGVLTLGPTGAAPALLALEGNDAVKLATFDLSPEVLTAIDEGRMLFAIDQQQYLQGYMGVEIMTLYAQYGLLLGGGDVVRTGPGFVTQETAAQVIDLSSQGIR
jgi:simple sugar transport system substrate-binding protein